MIPFGLSYNVSRAVCFPGVCAHCLPSGIRCHCSRMGWISTGHQRCQLSCCECLAVQLSQWNRWQVKLLKYIIGCCYTINMATVCVSHVFFITLTVRKRMIKLIPEVSEGMFVGIILFRLFRFITQSTGCLLTLKWHTLQGLSVNLKRFFICVKVSYKLD